MFIYTTLVGSYNYDEGTAFGTTQLTGWMERQGDEIFATVMLKDMSQDCQVKIDIIHKNRDDAGEGTSATGSTGATSSGHADQALQVSASALKELVRVEVTCSTTHNTSNQTDHCLAQLLAPQWKWSGA